MRQPVSRASKAFTLVEILLVVIILGILAAIVVPRMSGATNDARINTFVKNLKTYAIQVEIYHDRFGDWPPDQQPGVFPEVLANQLHAEPWESPSPIGGVWDWDNDVFEVTSGISIFEPDEPVSTMEKIDRMIDDGNLETGHFKARSQGYIFVIAE